MTARLPSSTWIPPLLAFMSIVEPSGRKNGNTLARLAVLELTELFFTVSVVP